MSVQVIPRDQWPTVCDRFSRQHQGWYVSIEVLDAETGARLTSGHAALDSIQANLKNRGADEIAIALGKSPDSRITHVIGAPARIELKRTADGADEALRIEAAGGQVTIVRLRSPALPETVNGLSDKEV